MARLSVKCAVAVAALSVLAAGCSSSGGSGGSTTGAANTPAAANTAAAPSGGSSGSVSTTAKNCKGAVGLIAPLTGNVAVIGQEQLHWAQLALDTYNQQNGTSFTLEQGDAKFDPAQATTVAQKFVSDSSVLVVVGPSSSGNTQAVGPLFKNANMAFISGSGTATNLTDGTYPTFFRVVAKNSLEGAFDAKLITDTLHAKKVAIVDDQSSYAVGLADDVQKALKSSGISVSRQSVNQKQIDYASVVSKISSDTDVVYLPWQIAANGQLFAQQMQQQNKKAVIVGSDGLASQSEFHPEGAYVTGFSPDITQVAADADIVKAFQAKYSGSISTYGPPEYTATIVALTALSKACAAGQLNRKGVLAAVKATNLPSSILGVPISFTASGDLTGAKFYVFKVEKGKYVMVDVD